MGSFQIVLVMFTVQICGNEIDDTNVVGHGENLRGDLQNPFGIGIPNIGGMGESIM